MRRLRGHVRLPACPARSSTIGAPGDTSSRPGESFGWAGDPGRHSALVDAYLTRVGVPAGDLVHVSVAARVAVSCCFELPRGWRFAMAGNQPDAADESLLSCIQETDLRTYGGVFIGSGDHRFVEVAWAAKSAAIPAICVTGGGRAARALVRACDSRVALGTPVVTAGDPGRPVDFGYPPTPPAAMEGVSAHPA